LETRVGNQGGHAPRSTSQSPARRGARATAVYDDDRDDKKQGGQIQFLHDWSQRSDKNVLFLGVSPFNTLPRTQLNNIKSLNDAVADLFGPQYIAPLTEEQVRITDRDGQGVHYSVITANATLDLISPFFKLNCRASLHSEIFKLSDF